MTKEYRDPEKWLTPELSIGQKLELEQIRRAVSQMSREKLEEMTRSCKNVFWLSEYRQRIAEKRLK